MEGGDVIYRDKVVWRRSWLLGLPGLLCLIGAVVLALTPGPWWVPIQMGAMALLFGALWMLFSVMRTVVTAEQVHVQYGLFGPRVPIEKIQSVEVVDYDWVSYGGWGIKYSVRKKAWAYTTLTDHKQVVQMTWLDDKGATKKAVFSASNPHAVAEAIQRARSGTAMRIEIDETDERAYEEALAEAEAMAEEITAEEQKTIR